MDRLSDEATVAMNQRIASRRQALEAKLRAKRAGNTDVAHTEEEETKLGKGEEQVKESRQKLNMLKNTAFEAVTQYRVQTDVAENERRIREESMVAARVQKTLDEAGSSQRRHGSIQMKFDSLFQYEVPQELARDIELQKDACQKVIDAKEKLITEFRSQLRDKEEEYVKALKKQAEDIDDLIVTMHGQTDTMVSAYARELSAIEEAYNQERRELLEANEQEIVKLVEERTTREKSHSKKREERVWEDQKTLDDKYEENAEKYNKCKTDQQHEIHGLGQELERMRSLYLLNAERLHYNLQVLRERVKENTKAINQHKRKLARLQDVLSSLITKYTDTDKRFRQANNELTESYRRVTEQYKDLQLKFQHFERADAEKYQQVWAMHEKQCMDLVHKCLQGDRVIFEEQLGVSWFPPSLDFWLQSEQQNNVVAEAEEEEEGQEHVELGDMATEMLKVLWDQLPFLVEDRVRQEINDLEESEDTNPRKVDAILQALGITQTQEVNRLLEHFVVHDENDNASLLHPQQAVGALQRFLEERQREQAQTVDTTAKAKPEAKQKEDTKKTEMEFWRRMSNVISEPHYRVWNALESGLNKYHQQLIKRANLIEETDSIRKQNDELRALLNQYLGSKINEELFAPPQLQVVQPTTSVPSPSS